MAANLRKKTDKSAVKKSDMSINQMAVCLRKKKTKVQFVYRDACAWLSVSRQVQTVYKEFITSDGHVDGR